MEPLRKMLRTVDFSTFYFVRILSIMLFSRSAAFLLFMSFIQARLTRFIVSQKRLDRSSAQ